MVCKPLHKLFTDSLTSGNMPADWKRANITPIFKKGSKSDPLKSKRYRPVSLTSVASKVLEKLIREKLVSHLENTGYLL